MKLDFSMDLRALDSTDCQKIRQWRNDWRIWAWTRQNDLISDVEQTRWFERQSLDPTIKMYGVTMKVNGSAELIGVAGLTSLDWANRRAEFSLYIAPDQQKNGYGRQALSMLLTHGFENLGLNQIWGETFEGNPALKMFIGLGFNVDGKRRDFYWKDGKFVGAHMVSMLASEWRAKHGIGASAAGVQRGESHSDGCDSSNAGRDCDRYGDSEGQETVAESAPAEPLQLAGAKEAQSRRNRRREGVANGTRRKGK